MGRKRTFPTCENEAYSVRRGGSGMLKYISVRKLRVAMLVAPRIAPSMPSAWPIMIAVPPMTKNPRNQFRTATPAPRVANLFAAAKSAVSALLCDHMRHAPKRANEPAVASVRIITSSAAVAAVELWIGGTIRAA